MSDQGTNDPSNGSQEATSAASGDAPSAADAGTARLGDREVRRIGYGAMQLAGPGVKGPPKDPDEARAVLRRAIELGVDHLDTAQFYGPDVVNELIREALHPYPDGLAIVTKIGCRRPDEEFHPALSAQELREDVEANLRELRVERLDLVNLRSMLKADDDPAPFLDGLGALVELREEGKIDQIGVSTVTREVVERSLEVAPIAEVQNSFSIIDRSDQETVDLTRERGVAYVPYFPLGSAFTGGPQALAEDEALAGVAEKHGVSASQIALAWLLAHSDNVLLIPGTGSLAHLEENLAVGAIRLDDEDMATLERVEQLGDPMDRMEH